jgi:hypothetical protein
LQLAGWYRHSWSALGPTAFEATASPTTSAVPIDLVSWMSRQ